MALDALVAKTSRGATSREAHRSASHSGAIVSGKRMKIRENPREIPDRESRSFSCWCSCSTSERIRRNDESVAFGTSMVQVVLYTVPPHVRAMKAVFIVLLGYIVYKYIVQHQGQPPGESYSAR